MHAVTRARFSTPLRRIGGGAALALALALPAAASDTGADDAGAHGGNWLSSLFGFADVRSSRISDESVPVVDPEAVPDRPSRLELGDAFVGTGPISKGFVLPTGAVWTPSFLIFGTHRSAMQAFDTGRELFSEWANRLDIFGNLILSGTERVLVGFRPFDEGFAGPNPATGRFTGYYFEPGNGDFKKEFNADLISLFFEADIGELFPRLDPEDKYPLDISVTVGRQPLFYQEGILIFDTMDAVGISKNSIRLPGTSNLQISGLYAWNEINRGNNVEVSSTDMVGLFFAVDHPWTTMNLDLLYTFDQGQDQDGFYFGLSFVQRIGHFSTAIRAVTSIATDEDGNRAPGAPTSVVDTGSVIFAELMYPLPWSRNGIYATFFWGIKDYTPAARMPGTGGPMGRAGLNFAGQGLGRYAAPVPNFAQDVVGGALGFQAILDGELARRQIIFELGLRKNTDGADTGTAALLTRFQQAFGQHVLMQLDLFGAVGEERSPGWGARMEWRYAF